MFDLYLFNTIVNTIWYIFTILFVLYRFTSFFSYIYNFSRFCGKIFTGIHYIYTSVTTKNVKYQNINIESQSTPKSTFQRFKETCKKKWRQLFGKESSTVIPKYENVFPLVETTTCSDGKPGEWGAWICDGKNAKSTRTCEAPVNGGAPCPELERNHECSHGRLTEWGSWICDGKQSKKTRSCIQPTYGGNQCPNEPLEETEKCSNGQLTEWSNWECKGIISPLIIPLYPLTIPKTSTL